MGVAKPTFADRPPEPSGQPSAENNPVTTPIPEDDDLTAQTAASSSQQPPRGETTSEPIPSSPDPDPWMLPKPDTRLFNIFGEATDLQTLKGQIARGMMPDCLYRDAEPGVQPHFNRQELWAALNFKPIYRSKGDWMYWELLPDDVRVPPASFCNELVDVPGPTPPNKKRFLQRRSPQAIDVDIFQSLVQPGSFTKPYLFDQNLLDLISLTCQSQPAQDDHNPADASGSEQVLVPWVHGKLQPEKPRLRRPTSDGATRDIQTRPSLRQTAYEIARFDKTRSPSLSLSTSAAAEGRAVPDEDPELDTGSPATSPSDNQSGDPDTSSCLRGAASLTCLWLMYPDPKGAYIAHWTLQPDVRPLRGRCTQRRDRRCRGTQASGVLVPRPAGASEGLQYQNLDHDSPPTEELAIRDSTLQYLLWLDGSGRSYGVESVDDNLLHQAVICPGASLVMPRAGSWASLAASKEGAYDWLADVRDQYGLAAFGPDHYEVGSIAARRSHKQWILRRYLEPGAMDRPMPKTAFLTYIHDDMPGPRDIFKNCLPSFERTFCNDEALFTTLTLHAGDHGAHLCSNVKQPAHRDDIFRYIYHYNHGGQYFDIKFGFTVPFDNIMQILAQDWGSAQQQLSEQRGLGRTQKGKLPSEFLLMAIGIKKDHIFQGIIYGQPRHSLFMRAIAPAFSKEVLSKVANLDYMIFCKALWKFLKDDMKQEPAVGWNISPTYGPVYLLQENFSAGLRSKGHLGNDGHYFVTQQKITVAYTRCWHWQKGFKGDPRPSERRATTMLQGLPQAVAEALDARRVYGHEQEGTLPGGEIICDDVQVSINSNSFEDIMDAVRQEKNYAGISAEDAMRFGSPSEQTWLANLSPLLAKWQARFNAFEDRREDEGSRSSSPDTRISDTEGSEAQSPSAKWLTQNLVPLWRIRRMPYQSETRLSRSANLNEMFTWVHALASILVISEKAFTAVDLKKVSEQLKMWQDRIRIRKKPPWIFAPLNLVQTEQGTTWEEAMTARPVMRPDGLLTIALGEGDQYRVLPKVTGFFGIISSLFKG
ncbi:unnamed protein product [Symbiodinium microadriaticum]|nr:unnamed protein product [Symbiodinium microadriaticum]